MLTWPQLSQWRDVDHPIPQIQTLLCPQFEFVCWLLMSNHSISPPLPSVPSVSTSLVCLFIKSLASAYGHFNERLCCNGWPSPVHNLQGLLFPVDVVLRLGFYSLGEMGRYSGSKCYGGTLFQNLLKEPCLHSGLIPKHSKIEDFTEQFWVQGIIQYCP